MRVIPVIDLMNGQVVRGIGGRRSEYRPIHSQLAAGASPATIARAFVEHFGFDTAYVADLDAIQASGGRKSSGDVPFNPDAWRAIQSAGLSLWLDAGVGTLAATKFILNEADSLGLAPRLIIGLESLQSPDELAEICTHTADPIFSLDLKNGQPLHQVTNRNDWSPLEIAKAAFDSGIRDLIVLDLADVGASGGTRTLELCNEIRDACDFREIIAGGGIRGIEDLTTLANAGCTAALVASALHDGHLTPKQLLSVSARAQNYPTPHTP
jgi:phosphoribosylformimino-5-aminoimidazole carboxamide ribotide isomerase